MKLEYKILWLDDQISDFKDDDIIEEVEEYLINDGFSPEITTCDNSKDFFSKLDDSYDIILTDYHMNDINGNQVVEQIRGDHAVMTEILFYTAKASLEDTKKISRVSFLETDSKIGNHAEIVADELKKLINLTIKRTEHLNNLRGLVMAESSEIENLMKQILKLAITKFNISDQEIELCPACNKKHRRYECGITGFNFQLRNEDCKMKTINKANSGKLLQIIGQLLNSGLFETNVSINNIKDYTTDLKRNILAHSFEVSRTYNEVVLEDFDGRQHPFNQEDFKRARRHLKKYGEIFNQIKNDILKT